MTISQETLTQQVFKDHVTGTDFQLSLNKFEIATLYEINELGNINPVMNRIDLELKGLVVRTWPLNGPPIVTISKAGEHVIALLKLAGLYKPGQVVIS